MKKQFFIFFLLILTATVTSGQMKAGSAPQPLTACTTDALHPLAGVPYNYSATVNPTGGNFQWWATKDVNFITTPTSPAGPTVNNSGTRLTVAGNGLLRTSTNYGTAGSLDNVDITWSSATLAGTTTTTPTFVVLQNDATGTNCANNLKVYQITAVNGFTVDIKNMDQSKETLAYAAAYSLCASNIASATYVVTGGVGAIVTDYGTNILYFEVVAANFTGGYTPSFQVSGLAAGQTVTSINVFTDALMATSAIATTLTTTTYSTAAPITVDPAVINTTTGVSLYVKVTIANGTHENLTGDLIALSVNGTNLAGEKDVVNTSCATQTDFEDKATQTITARPKVVAAIPALPFVTP